MIRKKHRTLCFSLFLALSMVLTQLIPVAATDEVPTEEPAPVTEQTVPAAEEPAQDPDPEPTAGEVPEDPSVDGMETTPPAADPTEPTEPAPEEEHTQPEKPTEPSEDGEEVKPEEEGIQEYTAKADSVKVKATAAKGALPEGAVLKAAKLDPESPEYKKAGDTLDSQQVEYTGFVAMDIHFEVDGQEVEPAADKGGVQVELKVDKKELPAENAEEAMQTLEVQHHEEQGTAVTAVPVAKAAESTVREEGQEVKADFSVDNFSTFTITWTTGDETKAVITIHTVDKNGIEIDSFHRNETVASNSRTIDISEYAGEVEGYLYSYAYILDSNGVKKPFETISFARSGNSWYGYSYSVTLNTSPNNTVKTFESGSPIELDLYLLYERGDTVLSFNTNGGLGTAPASLVGFAGDTVVLPQYSGRRYGYTFAGWSTSRRATDGNYHKVHQPGSSFQLERNTTLYAVWTPNQTFVGEFYIRKDGKIPTNEPDQFGTNEYTSPAIKISGAVKNHFWTLDSRVDGLRIEGNHAVNDVTEQLNALPNDQQIKKVYPSYDSSKHYILWYVQKYSSPTWHIDGVLLNRSLLNVSYDKNCDDMSVKVPNGYQVKANTLINIGSSEEPNGKVTTPHRDNYTFLGWNTKPDGTGTPLEENFKYVITENTTFYAQWSRGTVPFVLKHTVSGNMADQNKYFEFFLDVKDHNSDPITTDIGILRYDATSGKHTVTLKHNDSVRVNLPIGSTVAVSQAQEADYSTTHGSPAASDPGLEHSAITLDADINTNTVHFNNHKEVQVPTGMNDQNNALHGVVLSAGVVLILVGAIVALRRRMNAV